MRKIEDIKSDILADHIHRAERYPKVIELCEEAEKDLRSKRFPDQSPLAFFEQIADSIEKLKELRQLTAEMQCSGYVFRGIGVDDNRNYYEECFSGFIAQGKKTLKKLLPFVTDYLSDFPEERFTKLVNGPLAHYYSKTLQKK